MAGLVVQVEEKLLTTEDTGEHWVSPNPHLFDFGQGRLCREGRAPSLL